MTLLRSSSWYSEQARVRTDFAKTSVEKVAFNVHFKSTKITSF